MSIETIGRLWPTDPGIVGGNRRRETPVPIPNTEAKAPTLMVVRERECRSLPTFMKARWETNGPSFCTRNILTYQLLLFAGFVGFIY